MEQNKSQKRTVYVPVCSLDSGWNKGDGETMFNFIKGQSVSPYRNVEKREIGNILVRALGSLSYENTAIIVKYYVHGMTDIEIKKDLGLLITRVGVAFRRQRALKELKNILWQKYCESDLI